MKATDAKPVFHWDDPLLLEDQLTEEERMVRDSARAYCQEKLKPRILEAHRHEHFDRAILSEMGALGGPRWPLRSCNCGPTMPRPGAMLWKH